MNPLIIIFALAAGAIAIATTKNVAQTAITASQLSVRILSVDTLKTIAGGLELRFSIAVDNPTNKYLSIKKPYIKILLNGNEVANSTPSSEVSLIKANDRTVIKGLSVGIPYSNVPSVLIALTTGKKTNSMLTIEVKLEAGGIRATTSKNYKLDDLISIFNT